MRALVVALVWHACALSLVAQDVDTQEVEWTERCARAVEVLRGGVEPRVRRTTLQYLWKCGAEGGRALAAELNRLSTSTDKTVLEESYYPIAGFVDAAVLDSAMDVAADGDATVEARIFAFKVLIALRHPRKIAIPFASFLPGNPMVLASQSDVAMGAGSPLPDGWEEDVAVILSRIEHDPQEGDTIRFAAHRATLHFRSPGSS